jgi:bacteriocin-like protein
MTNDMRVLNDSELAAVTGGGATLTLHTNNTITPPHLPQAKDLLTPEQINKLLSIPFPTFNPPAFPG